MNWDDWQEYLCELIGWTGQSGGVLLLSPRRADEDLTEEQAEELAVEVHDRLFNDYRGTAADVLRSLAVGDAAQALPLLYISAWLARQQEDSVAFWPHFDNLIVRGSLATRTVQGTLAPLITSLWWKLHREWGVYRPQEGPVNVKWPQAHAGLTEGEEELLARLLVRHVGKSAEPPEILFDDPLEMLALLRVLLQISANAPRRLERLVFGSDGPGLIVAALAQSSLLAAWPPDIEDLHHAPLPHPSPPFIKLTLDPFEMSVVLPDGSLPGYSLSDAIFGDARVVLDCSYFAGSNQTRYKAAMWPITSIPWPRDVVLRAEQSVLSLRVPNSPFGASRSGALMFDAGDGRLTRKWWPNREYLLVLQSSDNPNWLSGLFIGAEILTVAQLGDLEVKVVAAVARDVALLDADAASRHLEEMELEIDRSGAAISLPDLSSLYSAEVLTWGGWLVSDGRHPQYQADNSPALIVRNSWRTGVDLNLCRREDDGTDVTVASAQIPERTHQEPVVLRLPVLPAAHYVVKGTGPPSHFNLVEDAEPPEGRLDVELALNRSSEHMASDDMRRFEAVGLTIKAWPSASVAMTVNTEAGSRFWMLRCSSAGRREVTASEVQLDSDILWAEVQCSAWLSKSNTLRLELRPHIPTDGWTVQDGVFQAHVRGASTGQDYQAAFVPTRPWLSDPLVVESSLNADGELRVKIPASFSGWLVIGDSDAAWFLCELGDIEIEYSGDDIREAVDRIWELPNLLLDARSDRSSGPPIVALYGLSRLAQTASIPEVDRPVPDPLVKLIDGYQSARTVQFSVGGEAFAGRLLPAADTLVLMGRSYPVELELTDSEQTLTFLGLDRPCICGHCDSVMPGRSWGRSHKCVSDPSIVTSFPPSMVVSPTVDWASVIETVKLKFLDCVESESEPSEPQLRAIWETLQETFRESSIEGKTPAGWIGGSADGWMALYSINEGGILVTDLDQVWEKVEAYQAGITAFSGLNQC